jgi:hypothetical protein
MRVAVVENGVVTNVIVANEPTEPNWVECGDEVGIGWLYDGTEFTAPPPPPPAPGELTPTDNQILGAPDTLFGGPTMREVFDVHATGD